MRRLHMLLLGLALVASTAAVTAQITSTRSPQDPPEWLRHCERCVKHQLLDHMEGRWHQTLSFWPAPGAEPEQSETAAEYKWIFGGRFLVGNISGYALGERIEVVRTVGYDSFRKEYFSFLIDNRSTSYMLARGTWDEASKTLTMQGTSDDITSALTDRAFKIVQTFPSKDEWQMEMFMPGADGKPFRTLLVKSVRAE